MIGFSQTFLTLTADVDGDVCPDVDVMYECVTDGTFVTWTVLPSISPTSVVKGSSVEVVVPVNFNLTSIPSNDFTTKLTITYSDLLNYTTVVCATGNGLMDSIPYNRVLGK